MTRDEFDSYEFDTESDAFRSGIQSGEEFVGMMGPGLVRAAGEPAPTKTDFLNLFGEESIDRVTAWDLDHAEGFRVALSHVFA